MNEVLESSTFLWNRYYYCFLWIFSPRRLIKTWTQALPPRIKTIRSKILICKYLILKLVLLLIVFSSVFFFSTKTKFVESHIQSWLAINWNINSRRGNVYKPIFLVVKLLNYHEGSLSMFVARNHMLLSLWSLHLPSHWLFSN